MCEEGFLFSFTTSQCGVLHVANVHQNMGNLALYYELIYTE